MLGLVSHVGAKVPPNDAMPGAVVPRSELVLQVAGDLLVLARLALIGTVDDLSIAWRVCSMTSRYISSVMSTSLITGCSLSKDIYYFIYKVSSSTLFGLRFLRVILEQVVGYEFNRVGRPTLARKGTSPLPRRSSPAEARAPQSSPGRCGWARTEARLVSS